MNRQRNSPLSPTLLEESVSSFGEFIKRERVKRRLSQAALAQAAGIAPLTVGKIELGKTDSSRLHTKVIAGLAQALGILISSSN